MPTEEINVKIEELQPGDVLPGGAVVTRREGPWIYLDRHEGLNERDMVNILGPTVTVRREVPALEPFEGVVDIDPSLCKPYNINVPYECPRGTKFKCYPAGTEPRVEPVPDDVREAAEMWACDDGPPCYARTMANYILSRPKPVLPVAPENIREIVRRAATHRCSLHGPFIGWSNLAAFIRVHFDCGGE